MDTERAPLILVVDEDRHTSRVLARLLREDGFEVDVAVGGAAGIGRLTRTPVPDALVSALWMPGADGRAIAEYARSRRPDIPVVFITEHSELIHPEQSRANDHTVVHAKPVDYAALVAQLSLMLETGGTRRRERTREERTP